MKHRTTHFTNFGVQLQPSEADSQGFLHYRDGFQSKIDPNNWKVAEIWIVAQQRRLDEWRKEEGLFDPTERDYDPDEDRTPDAAHGP